MSIAFLTEHLAIAARHPEELKAWLVRVLGAEVVAMLNAAPPAYMVRLAGGLMIEIYQAQTSPAESLPNTEAGWRHLALQVVQLEPVIEQLVAAGVVMEGPIKPAGGGGRVQFFRDPEGNLYHLVERPAGSPFALRP